MPTSPDNTQQEKVAWRKAFHDLNDSELRTIVFDLGIKFDALGGRDINERIMSLLDFLAKDGRLAELKAYIFAATIAAVVASVKS